MNKSRLTYIINILFPCVLFSATLGTLTSVVICLFKLSAAHLAEISARIYAAVRSDIRLLPFLIIGAAVIGLAAGFILKSHPNCRGGGIPTAVAALRGYIPFERVGESITVFLSSMLTYFCGVPLGTEGPSVQIGALLGSGMAVLSGKRHRAWRRYIMTGGACAGFAVATGAPVTGIFFAFEEAHRRFSPMLFMIASMTVASSVTVSHLLSQLLGASVSLFRLEAVPPLPLRYLFVPAAVGIICGVMAFGLTVLYRFMRKRLPLIGAKLPFAVRIGAVFALCAMAGYLNGDLTGTGHGLIEKLFDGEGFIPVLIIILLLRMLLMLLANSEGVTGGLFIPNLAFGAIIGSICGKLAVHFELLPAEYYLVTVVIGMVSFLAASSRIPITALLFALEALAGFSNIIPVMLGVTLSFVFIELMGEPSFSDRVIESKTESYNRGLKAENLDLEMTVGENAFVIGKEIHDILWPHACVIVSINNNPSCPRIGMGMAEGDVLHIHCKTAHPEDTVKELRALLRNE